jgi:hypothetical protein
VVIPPESVMSRHNCPPTPDNEILQDRVVAVRLPCMSTSHFKDGKEMNAVNGQSEGSTYAFLVLVLPCDPMREWHTHELDMVTAVADQVFVQTLRMKPTCMRFMYISELSFNSMCLYFGSWSPMISHWFFCIQNPQFPSTCASLEVVFECK